MTKIKICGLRGMEEIAAVNQYRPDYAGCILSEGFKRTVSKTVAKELRQALRPEISLVGVFVDDDVRVILDFLEEGIIDIAQLHGQETEEMILEIQKKSGRPVWKVFRMETNVDFERMNCSLADQILLDAGTGSGKTFDWSQTRWIKRPFILAGGLTPENVNRAILQTHPYGVDTSSGVESDGRKDSKKIAAFIEKIRREN